MGVRTYSLRCMNKIPSGFGLSVIKLDVSQPSLHDQLTFPYECDCM